MLSACLVRGSLFSAFYDISTRSSSRPKLTKKLCIWLRVNRNRHWIWLMTFRLQLMDFKEGESWTKSLFVTMMMPRGEMWSMYSAVAEIRMWVRFGSTGGSFVRTNNGLKHLAPISTVVYCILQTRALQPLYKRRRAKTRTRITTTRVSFSAGTLLYSTSTVQPTSQPRYNHKSRREQKAKTRISLTTQRRERRHIFQS